MENSNTENVIKKAGPAEPTPDLLPDEAVIKQVAEGNADRFEIIVKRYNQRLFRIIRSYLSDRQDIEDVMQTTYLKAYKNLKQFRGESKFSTWLIRIAIHEALKKLKGQDKISNLHSVTDSRHSDLKDSVERYTPESTMIQKDMNSHLEKAIDALPPKYRSVLIMRSIEQLSTEETAEILGISQANVKVRLYRAKSKLRDKLTERLGDIDLFSFKGRDCDRFTEQVMSLIKKE